MKTNQILKRDFMGATIRQQHKTQFFNINDFTKIANEYRKNRGLPAVRFDVYLKSAKTKEFITELMKSENMVEVIKTSRGKNGSTYAHPLIFLDYVMYVSPEFKVKAYKYVYDNLAIFRDNSGDSYKDLTSTIKKYNPNISMFSLQKMIKSVARAIKKYLKVDDWNCASENQLKLRDQIQKNMQLLIIAGVGLQNK